MAVINYFYLAVKMRQVFPGDRVLVFAEGRERRGRREAVIYEVIERNTEQVVGHFRKQGGFTFVEPDNKKIPHDVNIPADHQANAKDGDIVVAEIMAQPTARKRPMGRIVEVLGEHMAPGMEIEVALRAHNVLSSMAFGSGFANKKNR